MILRRRNVIFTTLLLGLVIIVKESKCRDEHDGDENFGTEFFREFFDEDGFKIETGIMSEISDELRSNEESHFETSTRHPFQKICPDGFFKCTNSECIAAKWRCDGHYDCDDLSDELNCTTIVLPTGGKEVIRNSYTAPVVLAKPASVSHDNHPPASSQGPLKETAALELVSEFNSSVEPLMIFSTGSAIRGLWMKERIYFDIVNKNQPKSSNGAKLQQQPQQQPPSITSALSILFDMFQPELTSSSARAASVGEDKESSKPKSTIVGIDMDPTNKEVYWVELGSNPGVYSSSIEPGRQLGSKQERHKKIVEYGLLSPEDIALDTAGKNAYITDAGLRAIIVCPLDRSHCKIILEKNVHKPRAIAVDSSIGWVYYTDWGDWPGIYLVSMDGQHTDTLIDTNIVWPNGLALDYSSNFLYWADARLNKIERVDLKTKKRFDLLKETKTNPFSVSVFENRVYWSDWSGNDIKSCDKISGNSTKVVMKAEDIYGIHIYHPDIHKNEVSNPCWSKRCSHICLLSPQSADYKARQPGSVRASCACPDGMTLGLADRSTCYEMHLSFLLINQRNYIAQMFPERIGLNVIEDLIYSKDHAIQDIAADWFSFRLFFFDASRKVIYEADFTGSKPELHKLLPVGSSVRGLMYESLSEILYWLDSDAGTMSLFSLKSKFKKIMRTHLDHPTSLAFDTRNKVFYVAQLGSQPSIMRTDIHATPSSDVTLINSDIGLPVALHLDEVNQRLYWADARLETIESLELDIKSKSTGVKSASRTRHRKRLGTVLSFTVYGDSFLWTSQDNDYLYKAKLESDPKSRPVAFKLLQNPSKEHPATDSTRLLLVDPAIHGLLTNPCAHSSCSHACVVDSNHEPECICPDNYSTHPSNSSKCVETPTTTSWLMAKHDGTQPVALNNVVVPHPWPATVHHDGDVAVPPSELKINHNEHELKGHDDVPLAALNGLAEAVKQHQHGGDVSATPAEENSDGNRMVWLIVLLLLLSVVGLITVLSLLILYKQGKFQRQVSQLTVSFISPGSSGDKDRAMLLEDC